jgi:hypothetical protein
MLTTIDSSRQLLSDVFLVVEIIPALFFYCFQFALFGAILDPGALPGQKVGWISTVKGARG